MSDPVFADPDGVAVLAFPDAGLSPRAGDDVYLAAWTEFEASLMAALGPDWRPAAGLRGDADLVAASARHEIALQVDDVGRCVVVVAPRRDLLGRGAVAEARARLVETAAAIFDPLKARWRLRVPAGARATAPYRADRLGRCA